MNHTITIEGDPQSVPAEDGETILDAAAAQRRGLRLQLPGGQLRHLQVRVRVRARSSSWSTRSTRCRRRSGRATWCSPAARRCGATCEIRRLSAEEFVVHPSRVMQCRVDGAHPAHPRRAAAALRHRVGRAVHLLGRAVRQAAVRLRRRTAARLLHGQRARRARARVPPARAGRRRERAGARPPQGRRPGARSAARSAPPICASSIAGPILAIAGGTGLAPIRSIVARGAGSGRARAHPSLFRRARGARRVRRSRSCASGRRAIRTCTCTWCCPSTGGGSQPDGAPAS